jgi:hypothetical protein
MTRNVVLSFMALFLTARLYSRKIIENPVIENHGNCTLLYPCRNTVACGIFSRFAPDCLCSFKHSDFLYTNLTNK